MYFDYWHLQKPPFDNVPDPSMYAECHTSMENAIAETLFAIEEGNECLAVIVGDVGLGKTLSLRIIIDSLSPEKYQMALITNPSISFVQLLNEIIGQLTESPCNEKRKSALLEMFNKLLFQKADAGKKIVLLIDEANAITPANLESLRLLTNMQDDQRNLFTMVLAGQIELAKRLEDPKRANFFQRIGTYSRIERIAPDQLRDYVETRLRLAGAVGPIFTEDTYPFFWRYSDEGVPRLINKIAKLSLKAGETYGLEQVTGQVVYQVAQQFEKITPTLTARGKARKKVEGQVQGEALLPVTSFGFLNPNPIPNLESPQPEEIAVKDQGSEEPTDLTETVSNSPMAEAEPLSPALVSDEPTPLELEKTPEVIPPIAESPDSPLSSESSSDPEPVEKETVPPHSSDGLLEEIRIGEFHLQISIPSEFIDQFLGSDQETRVKMAGLAAAQTLKSHNELATSPAADPFSIWTELRSAILQRLEIFQSGMAA